MSMMESMMSPTAGPPLCGNRVLLRPEVEVECPRRDGPCPYRDQTGKFVPLTGMAHCAAPPPPPENVEPLV